MEDTSWHTWMQTCAQRVHAVLEKQVLPQRYSTAAFSATLSSLHHILSAPDSHTHTAFQSYTVFVCISSFRTTAAWHSELLCILTTTSKKCSSDGFSQSPHCKFTVCTYAMIFLFTSCPSVFFPHFCSNLHIFSLLLWMCGALCWLSRQLEEVIKLTNKVC